MASRDASRLLPGVTALLFAVAMSGLTACGQTGPLYQPPAEAPEPASETVPEESSAAASSTGNSNTIAT
jgi:predicted small lipoprotein YifL